MRNRAVKKREGFTLIEMLIVITIVGVLSSMALSALNPARNKAKDTRVAEEVNQIRAYAEALYDGDYDALESLPASNIKNNTLRVLAEDIENLGSELTIRKIGRPAASYIMYATLNEKKPESALDLSDHRYYCVDSAGHVSYTFRYLETALSCPFGE